MYATCSLEGEENETVIRLAIQGDGRRKLAQEMCACPAGNPATVSTRP